MAINFPNSPSNGATHTAAGQTFTYDGTAGVWNPPSEASIAITSDGSTPSLASGITGAEVRTLIGAGGLGSGTTVVANATALPGSASIGDQAFVTGTNRLYLWNGTGWYNIALINTNPSISGANATYNLAIDGSATTVTITATDPEGLPITYSVASDTSGNIATVAQGTGASTNVWTITPSTNSAHAGTFSLTFRASDGINIASAVSSFTLQFTVVNQKYTTALITSVGANDAVNTSFDDKSTSNHTITANGDAHQTTFSPYRHGGYSVYCDGNDAVKFNETSSDEFTFGTGDFTMEGWFWIDLASIAAGGEHTLIGNNGTDGEMWFSVIGSNWSGPKYNFQTGTGSWANTVASGANTVKLREWVHLAVVRISGTVHIYENGVSVANGSNTVNIPNSNNMLSFMGRPQTYGQYATGYIHDVRITKGTGVYTSGFTPPTEKMAAVTNTKLLAFRKPYIVDESASPLSSTLDTGDPETRPFVPYDAQEYAAADHGGSLHSDGNGDYLAVAASSDFDLGTSDFTIEGWVYPTAYGNANFILGQNYFSSIIQINSGKLQFYSSPASAYIITAATDIALDVWTHWAVVRNGNAWAIYLNGKSDATVTNAADAGYDSTNPLHIMRWNNSNSTLAGTLADLRFVKGTAVYTSNFTPPTAPLTAITNTKLLVQSTDAGIIDKSQSETNVLLYNGAKSSTTQAKYLTSSMYFDGDAYIKSDMGSELYGYTGPFTIEAWIYPTSISQYANPIFNYGNSGSTGNDHFNFELLGSTGVLSARWDQAYPVSATAASVTPLNTWTHVAYTRDASNSVKIWINGTENASGTKSGALPTSQANRTVIGSQTYSEGTASRSYTGHISDLRVTKGLARYTSNFTAPTAALKG